MKESKFLVGAILAAGLLSTPSVGFASPSGANGHKVASANVLDQSDRTFKGQVVDDTGEPIIGAVIRVNGNEQASGVTDFDGNFEIKCAPGSELVISYVGYDQVTVKVKDNIVVTLRETSNALNEVVVTALGIKKEAKSLSYNVQEVKGDALMKVQDANFVNSLNGKVAGVTINASATGAGGSSRVVMRGAKSIMGNNNALYVINGIPMPNLQSEQPDGVFAGAGQTGDGVSNLNPEDIESLSVLSGPSAAALYGASAANGVILITTKQGSKEHTSISVSNSTQFSRAFITPKFQNTYGPSEVGSLMSWGDKLATPSSFSPLDFFQTGVNVTNSVSLSTGNERNQTYLSVGTTNSNGIVHSNNYDRYNVTFRNTTNFFDNKVTLDVQYMLTQVKEQNMFSQGTYHNPVVAAYLFPAGADWNQITYYERYNTERNMLTQYWPYTDSSMPIENPYWTTEHEKFENHKTRNVASASLRYEFAKGMSITGRAKYDNSADTYEQKFDAGTNTLFASKYGHYSLRNLNNRQLYAEAFLNVNRYFGKDDQWSVTFNLGTAFDQRDNADHSFSGDLKGVSNLFSLTNVDTGSAKTKYGQSGYTTRTESVYSSLQLGWKSMVYLDATARNDWSSKLRDPYFYPSIGLSGILTEIFPQIQSNDWLNYAKLRVSFSEVGNDPFMPFLTTHTYPMGNKYPQTTTRMENPGLKPEQTHSWEMGFDLALFRNKLRVNGTLYMSRTYNQFFQPDLPASSGYTSVIVNGGRVDNKGVELTARFSQPLGPVNWETYMTWTLNRNKIVELLNNYEINGEFYTLNQIDQGGTGGYKTRLVEGGTLNDIYVSCLRTDEHGQIYVNPTNNQVEKATNEYIYAGHASPDYNLSWGNTFSWKGIGLNFLFTYRKGGVVVSETQAVLDYYGASQASADARDAGGIEMNGFLIPAKDYFAVVGGSNGNSVDSRYVYDATNLRLSELAISYDVPVTRWVKWVKGMNVSLVAHNLFMIYCKAPFDPESTASTGTYNQGIDYFMQPSTRNLGFSVKLKF